MRVIAGTLKGRRLVTPRGGVTRPTADQVRIALLDTLAPRLPGARFLDLFAGAGGVGLEAISRGAAHATFVEEDARAVAALRANVETLGVAARVRIQRGDVGREVTRLGTAGARFTIVFLDPPYETDLVTPTVAAIGAQGLLEADGVVVAQHFTKRPPASATGGLVSVRTRRFGETTLTFFRADGYDSAASQPGGHEEHESSERPEIPPEASGRATGPRA
jgi:16S rRNA (guanine(966)-N(2))-methyltransferase RsmD